MTREEKELAYLLEILLIGADGLDDGLKKRVEAALKEHWESAREYEKMIHLQSVRTYNAEKYYAKCNHCEWRSEEMSKEEAEVEKERHAMGIQEPVCQPTR